MFFTGCTLQCSYCQNHQISRGGTGGVLSVRELGGIFIRLQDAGAENINLVTGTHFTPGIAEAVGEARVKGLRIPVVWNGSGFETPETLQLLEEFVDIYLPDLKTVDRTTSAELYRREDYGVRAKAAVLHMAESRLLQWKGDLLQRGVIVRHLVLPGRLDVTRKVLSWYAGGIGNKAMFSLMFQYTPPAAELDCVPGDLSRRISRAEYETVISMLDEFGIEEGFVQEFEDDPAWSPDFTRTKPFPADNLRVIWHC